VDDEWLRGISGIVETRDGDLWLNGLSGIFHISKTEISEALRNTSYRVKGEHFGRRDGLPGVPTQMHPLPTAIEGTDGRLWFALQNGVVWLDPTTYSEHRVPPPAITIESVSADDKGYVPASSLAFSARTSSVQISYAAVSLSDPEAIRFRYKLQETDEGWHEVAAAGPVTYRNLPPASYHFNVTASDSNGIWSNKVATADFTILPAFYQTLWFRSLCAITFAVLLAGLYQLRLKHLTRQYSIRVEERVHERTRIARDLHDTLLQSSQASLIHMQAARNLFPRRPEQAVENLDSAINMAAGAIAEGRDAIQQLRCPTAAQGDLPHLLNVTGQELARLQETKGNSVIFRVLIEGEKQELEPLLQDEIYRIACELLRNAFQHAEASQIEVEVRYERRFLRVHVRDNGKGIDTDILNEGRRAGHWGLPGMTERAKRIGAQLDFWSEAGRGTEVQLTVPASVAYRERLTRAGIFRYFLKGVSREQRY
jgi:signal transduction histidine kinase